MTKCVDCEFYEYNKDYPNESCPMNMGDTTNPKKDIPCGEFISKKKYKNKIHFLLTGNNNLYYRACDSFCCWVGKKAQSVLSKDVTCKNCKRTLAFKQALKGEMRCL